VRDVPGPTAPRALRVADAGGDGVMDVILAAGTEIVILKSPLAEGGPVEQDIELGRQVRAFDISDLNGDGLLDIVSALDEEVAVSLAVEGGGHAREERYRVGSSPRAVHLAALHPDPNARVSRKVWYHTPDGDIYRRMRNAASSYMTLFAGQPGFFKPHDVNPWFSPAGAMTATSYYDTSPLRDTLLELVDFDLINSRKVHFAVGAVNVLSGNFLYFDNKNEVIGPEHVMASGALPPALPMVKIGTDHFWDGGIVSNTPLQHLLDQDDKQNSLVFQVDLFSARGTLPRDIQEVLARHKDIVYSSRTRHNTDVYKQMNNLKTDLYNALQKVPEDRLSEHERSLRDRLADLPEITILQMIYQQKAYEGDSKDHEFSATSMREHWQSGLEDTRRTLKRRDWLALPEQGMGIVVHDVHRERDY
jgi:NTE family protein